MKLSILAAGALAAATISGAAQATTFTTTSPTSAGALPAGVTEIGGIVFDGIGLNGNRLVTQLAASTLFVGFASDSPGALNPLEIGTQTGFTPALMSQLGGGFSELAVRFTLEDGDTAPSDFDDGDNTLLLNGIAFGDWSAVATQTTDGTGTTLISSSFGFPDDELATGFFHSTDATALAALFTSMSSATTLTFAIDDTDPDDNFYDFTLGVDGSLIDIGTGPVITPNPNPTNVPLPGALPLALVGLGALGLIRRRG